MQFSWKNLKEALGELVTSKQLSVESAKLIQTSVETDVSPTPPTTASETPTPAVARVVSAPAPVPVAAPATPVATSPIAVVAVAENEELVRLRAENAVLKAKVTPGLAAAVPTDDATQSGQSNTANEENKHYADLKRIQGKFKKFGLTAEINLGDPE